MPFTILDGMGRRMVFPRQSSGEALGAMMSGFYPHMGKAGLRMEWERLRDEHGYRIIELPTRKDGRVTGGMK